MEFDVNKSKNFFGNGLLEKTLFDGKLTVKQLLLILVVVIAVIIVLKLVTGVMRTITTIIIIVFALLRFGLIAPAQIKDAGKQVAAKGISYYSSHIKSSDSIRANGNSIEVKVGEGDKAIWVPVDKIESIITQNPLTGKDMSVSVDGEIYKIKDDHVADLLKEMTDGNFLHKIFGTFKN